MKLTRRFVLAAAFALGWASPSFGQLTEIPPVKAPVGAGLGVAPVVVPGPTLGGTTLGPTATVSLAQTLPKPLIATPMVTGGPARASRVASSDQDKAPTETGLV